MKESNLSARPNYTHVSDDNLKVYMAGVLNKNPRFGEFICEAFFLLSIFFDCTILLLCHN